MLTQAERPMSPDPTTHRYSRDLPGGGFVSIAVERRMDGDHETPVTRVVVERRTPDRRDGHTAPVVAEADGDERSPAYSTLFQMTRDNAAIARALLEWQSRRSGAVAQDVVRAD